MRFPRYILPTWRGTVLAFSAVLWLLISLVNQTLFAFLLFAFSAALVIISFIAAFFSLHGISVRRGPAGDATVGQMLSLPLEVKNSYRRRRQDLIVQEFLPFTAEKNNLYILPPLSKKNSTTFDRRILATQRGEYRLNRVILRSGDPAGLFYREKQFSLPSRVIVYPPVLPVPDLFLYKYETSPASTAQPISVAGTSQDFYGVREYTTSDAMKYIHWRSSARCGKLMVKEFERNAVASAAIIIDAQEHFVSSGDFSNLEYLIQAAASITAHCAGMYCSLAFAAGGRKLHLVAPDAAASVRDEVFYNLATIKPGNTTLLPALNALQAQLSNNCIIYCFSLSDNALLRKALEELANAGKEIRWCCATKELFDKKKKKSSTVAEQMDTYIKPVLITPETKLDQALNLAALR